MLRLLPRTCKVGPCFRTVKRAQFTERPTPRGVAVLYKQSHPPLPLPHPRPSRWAVQAHPRASTNNPIAASSFPSTVASSSPHCLVSFLRICTSAPLSSPLLHFFDPTRFFTFLRFTQRPVLASIGQFRCASASASVSVCQFATMQIWKCVYTSVCHCFNVLMSVFVAVLLLPGPRG